MPKWLIIAEETVQADGAEPQRLVKVVEQLGTLEREKALVRLRETASRYRPDSLNGAPKSVCRNDEDSFLVVSTNGKWHAPCIIRLREMV